jgi:hypothetical protein
MSDTPGEVELTASFRTHLGPRFESAGVRIQFHYNQVPGIHVKVRINEEYRESLLQGLRDGVQLYFPNLLRSGSICILDVYEHEVDSSKRAFYKAGRLAIEQAYALKLLGA